MGNLLDGLFLYEVILMILGSILFSVIIFLIVSQKDVNKNHLMGITLSIVMIALPSIQSFSVTDGIINIERKIEELKDEPENLDTQKELEEEVSNISNRPISNATNLSTLSEANLELGKKEMAKNLAKEALKKSPENIKASEIVNVLETEETIKTVKSNPQDKKAKKKLKEKIEQLKEIPTHSGRRTIIIAQGYEVLGDEVMSKAYVDSTRMYQPQNIKLKRYEKKEALIPNK